MNIFTVDSDPIIAAQNMVDRHVVKMILETAQLLSTAHRIIDGYEVQGTSKTGRKAKRWVLPDEREQVLYSATHVNHPSAVWARETSENYVWLTQHFKALCDEYTYRYDKTHKTAVLWQHLKYIPNKIKKAPLTPFAIAMDEKYRISDDPIECYRNYYLVGKTHLHSWKRRAPPAWWVNYALKDFDLSHPDWNDNEYWKHWV